VRTGHALHVSPRALDTFRALQNAPARPAHNHLAIPEFDRSEFTFQRQRTEAGVPRASVPELTGYYDANHWLAEHRLG
jgi:hypothetical protein